MDILGIGPLELAFILILALIVLGPNDMVKAGRTIGRYMRKVVTSPNWRTIQQTSRDIRYLPNRLMREAGVDELKESIPTTKEIRRQVGLDNIKKEIGLEEVKKDIDGWQTGLSDWTTPPGSAPASSAPASPANEEPAPSPVEPTPTSADADPPTEADQA